MPDENYGFSQTRARLEEIVAQVRKKNTSLEASLDLLEEGVRLANRCTELIDHADWEAAAGAADEGTDADDERATPETGEAVEEEPDATVEVDETVVAQDEAEWAQEQGDDAPDESGDDESDAEKDAAEAES